MRMGGDFTYIAKLDGVTIAPVQSQMEEGHNPQYFDTHLADFEAASKAAREGRAKEVSRI